MSSPDRLGKHHGHIYALDLVAGLHVVVLRQCVRHYNSLQFETFSHINFLLFLDFSWTSQMFHPANNVLISNIDIKQDDSGINLDISENHVINTLTRFPEPV